MRLFFRWTQLLFCVFLISLSSLFATWKEELKTKIAHSQFPEWMLAQIEEDLEPFKERGVTLQDIEDTVKEYPSHGFIICQIKSNRLSWSCHPAKESNDFRTKIFIQALDALRQTVVLPDVKFLVFVGESFVDTKNQAPVFSWCKHGEWSKRTVCLPDYEALQGNYNFLKDVELGKRNFPWERKENKAFWRGGGGGGWGFEFMPRLKLVQLSVEFPGWIDAKVTNAFPDREENLSIPFLSKPVSVAEHLRYKYQILVDGHVSAFSRAYWQLFSNCVIFKNTSPWYQWFYRELRPYEHYIPYEADATDLVQKIAWAMEHDDFARLISHNANHFANHNLKRSDNMLYVYLLLNEYAKLQKFTK